ncbi:MAG: tripartite tricarboxylate transporter TctB family protein [Betaproteobacteria bacterium]|nr:tripartite tricarboxylate transporter TctB family protein [Betaproteobacteria bacterium]
MSGILRLVLPHGLLLAATALLYWAATGIQGSTGAGRIGPDAWPKAILVIMGLLCAWEIVRRLAVRPRDGGGDPGPPSGSEAADASQAPPAMQTGKLLAGAGLVFAYVVAVPWIGFFAATAVFLAAFPWFGGMRRPVLTGALGIAGSFGLVVVFMRVAYISLPLGEGPFKALSLALLAAIGVS